MTTLARTQEAFWHAVRHRDALPEHIAHFRDHAALTAARRLEIYRRAYWARMVNALRSLFPSVVTLVGDNRFAQLASRSLGPRSPSGWAIEESGSTFLSYLESLADEPFTAEVARFDWARWQVFVAPDLKPVTRSAELSASLPTSRVTIGPHVRTVKATIRAARQATAHVGTHDDTAATEVAAWAVWRSGFDVSIRRVPDVVGQAIDQARDGLAFAAWCQLLAPVLGPEEMAAELAAWFDRGWVTGCEVTT